MRNLKIELFLIVNDAVRKLTCRTEKIHKRYHSWQDNFWQRFELGTIWIRVGKWQVDILMLHHKVRI